MEEKKWYEKALGWLTGESTTTGGGSETTSTTTGFNFAPLIIAGLGIIGVVAIAISRNK